MRTIWNVGGLVILFLVAFMATAFAAGAAVPDDGSLIDLVAPVWNALISGRYLIGVAFFVVLMCTAAKRYATGKLHTFINGDAGGALLVLVASLAGSVAHAGTISLTVAWHGLGVAFVAAGGYNLIRKLVWVPLTQSKWYQLHAPGWLRAIVSAVLWAFTKTDADPEPTSHE